MSKTGQRAGEAAARMRPFQDSFARMGAILPPRGTGIGLSRRVFPRLHSGD
ncbi:hypothetical protein [Gemmobacter sp. 24YEA27]|uniref:hypothetical protein n=1 Tax=Gemmobacter sp. 24YEA27 TaxID=3040672 RepID=UPI0024B35CDB|nr:hypothetical protein [Gemmobacter sp. 24YEA27]